METINFIGLICLTWLITTGAKPIQFIKEFLGVDENAKGITKQVIAGLINCDLCLGFWIGFIYYQDILIACIFSLSCEAFGRILSKLVF